ncbi:MAG: hypothetical protein ACFFDT_03735 [Candidatus Hodarchaeota archaeon]
MSSSRGISSPLAASEPFKRAANIGEMGIEILMIEKRTYQFRNEFVIFLYFSPVSQFFPENLPQIRNTPVFCEFSDFIIMTERPEL